MDSDGIDSRINKLTQVVIGVAIESWRLSRIFERALMKLDAGEQARYKGRLRWFNKKVEESMAEVGLHLVNVEGQPFDPGVAATPLNLEEFEVSDTLIVDKMLEPIIMGDEGLVRTGTVTLRKMEL